MAATANKSERNGMHIQLSLFLHFYVLYLLLNSCDGNDVFWRHSMLVKQSFSKSSFDFISPVVCLRQTVLIWTRLPTEFGDCCRNVCTRHLSATPATWSSASWHMGKHITKRHRRSSWSVEKAVTCKHVGARPPVKRKPTLFRATNSQSS